MPTPPSAHSTPSAQSTTFGFTPLTTPLSPIHPFNINSEKFETKIPILLPTTADKPIVTYFGDLEEKIKKWRAERFEPNGWEIIKKLHEFGNDMLFTSRKLRKKIKEMEYKVENLHENNELLMISGMCVCGSLTNACYIITHHYTVRVDRD